MTKLALKVQGLTKTFKVWNRPSDMLVEAVTGRARHTDFTALEDVSFELASGSVLGVLGRNGAGKSTLLRLVAGTLDPTRGSVEVDGRIASILELGTGFHLDYSGRENIFLGGMCLGLSRKEIKAKFDEIVEFAELAEFIDRPFRTFSSGMQARLTFAVATSIDPDILIIDEALAVGDARFTLKSFDRIQQFRRRGKAILLVSHDINTVSAFCDQAILLERGKLIASGAAGKVANIYHELLFGPPDAAVVARDAVAEKPAPQSSAPVLVAVETADVSSAEVEQVDSVLPMGEEGADLLAMGEPAPEVEAPIGQPEDVPEPVTAVAEIEHIPHHLDNVTSEQFLRYGNKAVEIIAFRILDGKGKPVTALDSLQRYKFHLRLLASEDAPDVGVGILVRSYKGAQIFAVNSHALTPRQVRTLKAGQAMDILMPFDANLGHGTFFASAVASRSDGLKHDAQFDVLEFLVRRTECHDESMANLNMSFEFPESAFETMGTALERQVR